jgi:type IV pilus assembly protein PilV
VRGFTLVEVLVALFLLAVGVVGASATQATAQRTRHQAALLTSAVQLASSLAERMRANPVVMARPDSDNPYLRLNFDAASDAIAQPALCYGQADCTPAQMADFDVYELEDAVRAGFPRGRILVCRDAAVWDGASDAATWDCDSSAGAPVVIKLGWRGNQPVKARPMVALIVAGAGG